jgi:tRNA pseudouridine55 synthase
MDRILLIDKQKEWTSFDVVGKIRSRLRQATGQKVKVGHAGTLDPLATGLLIVLIGQATKQQDSFMKLDKVYEVELKLGQTSTTADEEGEKTDVTDRQPSLEELQKALDKFTGEIMQIPPVYSAIKIDGQRAYKLARAGKEVVIEPRKVTIHRISDLVYDYPKVTFTAHVSSGTYIRSLAQDVGEELKVGAFMSNLRRTSIGTHNLSDSILVDDFDPSELADPK